MVCTESVLPLQPAMTSTAALMTASDQRLRQCEVAEMMKKHQKSSELRLCSDISHVTSSAFDIAVSIGPGLDPAEYGECLQL
jgi:hypothetical protein